MPGRDHILKRVDGRLKILLAAAILVLVVASKGFLLPLSLVIAMIIMCIYLRIPARTWSLRFSEPLAVVLILILIKLFFSGKEPLFDLSLGGMKITGYKDGLLDGLAMAARIGGALSVVSILSFTTPFTHIISALSWLKVPKGIIETLMFAYRYIFMLSDEAIVIYCAQKNRLGYSNLRRGLSSFGMLAGSLTLKALEHSQMTASAMTQRGYDGSLPMMRHRPFKTPEIFGSALFLMAVVFLWAI